MTLRGRLLVALAYILLLAIVALEVPLVISLRDRVDAEVRSQARAQADVVAATVAGNIDEPESLDEEVVRATIFIRIVSLTRGYSGIQPALVQGLVDMLNHDVFPAVPEYGSLGASGDLIPLAHIAIVLTATTVASVIKTRRDPTASS